MSRKPGSGAIAKGGGELSRRLEDPGKKTTRRRGVAAWVIVAVGLAATCGWPGSRAITAEKARESSAAPGQASKLKPTAAPPSSTRATDVFLMQRRSVLHVPSAAWRAFLHRAFAENRPYDVLVRQILAADDTDRHNPTARAIDDLLARCESGTRFQPCQLTMKHKTPPRLGTGARTSGRNVTS